MARVYFLYRSQKDKAALKVRIQLENNKQQFEANTQIHTTKIFWNDTRKKQRGLSGIEKNEIAAINKKLDPLENYILEKFEIDNPKPEQKEWLKLTLIDYYNPTDETDIKRSDLLTDNIQHIIDTANIRKNAQNNLGLSKSRINSYKNLLKIIERYQEKKQSLRIKDFNQTFANNFLKWLISDNGYADSYALKKIDDLKAVCRDAEIDNIEVNKQLSKIKGGKISNENIIYLNEFELEKIENLTLESDKLENARKFLLLGCHIGQRGSDLLSLTASNIKNRNGLNVIELEQQKTKAKISIPILDKTAEIIKNGLPKKISIQNFNFYIKELCKIAELNEPTKGRKAAVRKEVKRVKGEKKQGHIRRKLGTYPKHELTSSHICRRSFASNLYGKMPTSLIMRITGHKTEKMLLQYIGKSDLDYAQQIADFYELQKLKAKRETTLKVVNQ